MRGTPRGWRRTDRRPPRPPALRRTGRRETGERGSRLQPPRSPYPPPSSTPSTGAHHHPRRAQLCRHPRHPPRRRRKRLELRLTFEPPLPLFCGGGSHPPLCIRRNARGTTRGTRHTRATCPRSHRRCCRTRTRRLLLLPRRRHLRRRPVSSSRLAPSPPSPPSQPWAVRTCALTRTSSARQSYPGPSHPRVSRPTVPRRARRTDDASADRCSS